jgi:hypothetical protein
MQYRDIEAWKDTAIMRNTGYGYGLAKLQLFCFPGPVQVAGQRKDDCGTEPFFFPDQNEADRGCEYFYGVACVFTTYAGELYNSFLNMDECRHLVEFGQRLRAYMFRTAAEWSEAAVLENENWERLREDAKHALSELGESLPAEPPALDIAALINPHEFRTSKEARRLLDS